MSEVEPIPEAPNSIGASPENELAVDGFSRIILPGPEGIPFTRIWVDTADPELNTNNE